MKLVFDKRQLRHRPEAYFRQGTFVAHPEQPERAILLRDRLTAEGHVLTAPRDYGLAPILTVHDADYVSFLRHAWTRWEATFGGDRPAVPNYHTGRRLSRRPEGIVGQLGYHSTDTACPVTPGTWEAVYWSAQSAIEGAELLLAGERLAYALCRPPGHHAYLDASNGFCFLNNGAIAARHLQRRFARVAILDVDTHAGQGTQDVFWQDGSVLYASMHLSPADYPPYFAGFRDETGVGMGAGATLNATLARGAGDSEILAALDELIAATRGFGAEAVVVSLGFDMAADDPLAEVSLSRDGFADCAARIAALRLPTLLVQEGGYLGPSLAENAATFLFAIESGEGRSLEQDGARSPRPHRDPL